MYGYHIIVHFTIDIYNRIAARSSIIREHTNIVIYSCQWKWWMALKHWCFQLVWYCWYVQPQEIQQRKKGSYLQELLFKGHESSVTWAYQHSDCQNAARVFIFASGWIKTSPEMMHIYIIDIYIYVIVIYIYILYIAVGGCIRSKSSSKCQALGDPFPRISLVDSLACTGDWFCVILSSRLFFRNDLVTRVFFTFSYTLPIGSMYAI